MSTLPKNTQTVPFPGLYGLVFDLIGTLTDDHTPVVDALVTHASRYPSLAKFDRAYWDKFAFDWDTAQAALLHVIASRGEYAREQTTYEDALADVASKAGITEWTLDERKEIAQSFSLLPAYKDTVPGLDALRRKYMICPLTNGSSKKILESNKRNGINFDLVLPSTVTRGYKPNPSVYRAGIDAFELEEGECLGFVAAHAGDLAAAGKQGFKTFYIERANTDIKGVDPEVMASFDLVIKEGGIEELARQLGATGV